VETPWPMNNSSVIRTVFGGGDVSSAGRLLTMWFWRTGNGSKRGLRLTTRPEHPLQKGEDTHFYLRWAPMIGSQHSTWFGARENNIVNSIIFLVKRWHPPLWHFFYVPVGNQAVPLKKCSSRYLIWKTPLNSPLLASAPVLQSKHASMIEDFSWNHAWGSIFKDQIETYWTV